MAYVKNTINPTINLEYFVPKDYDGDGGREVKMYASTAHMKGEVVNYFMGASGFFVYSAASSGGDMGPFGVCKEAIASGEYGWVTIQGLAYGARSTEACTSTGFTSMHGYYVVHSSGLCCTAASTLSSGVAASGVLSSAVVGVLVSTYKGSDATTDYGYMLNIYLPSHSPFI